MCESFSFDLKLGKSSRVFNLMFTVYSQPEVLKLLDEAGLQGNSSLHTQLFPGQLVPRFTQGAGTGPPAQSTASQDAGALIATGQTYGLLL